MASCGTCPPRARVHLALDAQPIVGVNAAPPIVGALHDVVRGVADHLLPARRDEELVGDHVPVPQPVVGSGRGQRVARLALFEPPRSVGQLARLLVDHGAQLRELQMRVAGQLPFFGERAGQLADLRRVERLLEQQQSIDRPELAQDVFPRIVRVGGADDDLERGIRLPQLFHRLHAIPAGRHAHVDEGQRIGAIGGARGLDQLQGLLALVGGIDVVNGNRCRRALAEEIGLGIVELSADEASLLSHRILRKSSWMARLSSTIKMRLLA